MQGATCIDHEFLGGGGGAMNTKKTCKTQVVRSALKCPLHHLRHGTNGTIHR